MSATVRELRIALRKIRNRNKDNSKLSKLYAELREKRPRVRAISVYTPFRVRFNHDDAELLLKPNAMTTATYIKNTPTTDIYIKTHGEILEEERKAFAQLKISKQPWRPRLKKNSWRDNEDFEDLNYLSGILNIENL